MKKSEAETGAEVLGCSFCNKAQNDVRKIIAGPNVNICDECVEVCVDIIMDDTRPTDAPPDPAENERRRVLAAKLGRDQGICTFCGKSAFSENLLTIEGRGMLCGNCADAVEEVLARGRPIE